MPSVKQIEYSIQSLRSTYVLKIEQLPNKRESPKTEEEFGQLLIGQWRPM